MTKGKTQIVLTNRKEIFKKRKNDRVIRTKAIFAVFIMVASALIVTGSAWGTYQSDLQPKLKLRWQIGDVETSKDESPWDEFGNIRATPYEIDFTVGQPDNEFPRRTGPYCQGRPNKINIKFNYKLWEGGKFIFRYSPGYTGCEKIKIYVDGELLQTFTDSGGHDSSSYCTHKMVKHTVVIPECTFECDEHTITILHASGDGALWDWLKLKTYEPPICDEDDDDDQDDDDNDYDDDDDQDDDDDCDDDDDQDDDDDCDDDDDQDDDDDCDDDDDQDDNDDDDDQDDDDDCDDDDDQDDDDDDCGDDGDNDCDGQDDCDDDDECEKKCKKCYKCKKSKKSKCNKKPKKSKKPKKCYNKPSKSYKKSKKYYKIPKCNWTPKYYNKIPKYCYNKPKYC